MNLLKLLYNYIIGLIPNKKITILHDTIFSVSDNLYFHSGINELSNMGDEYDNDIFYAYKYYNIRTNDKYVSLIIIHYQWVNQRLTLITSSSSIINKYKLKQLMKQYKATIVSIKQVPPKCLLSNTHKYCYNLFKYQPNQKRNNK